MIATLSGTIEEKYDNYVIINCGGVGYGLLVTNQTSGSLGVGAQKKLYVYEFIREGSHDLYGFLSRTEKQFFEKLIGVNGVGPKMAVSIMNLGSAEQISGAIGQENTAFIMQAAGVGRRLAERIVVDLKEAFADAVLLAKVKKHTNDDALQALLSLGYNQSQAISALAQTDSKTTEDQIKQALKVIAQ